MANRRGRGVGGGNRADTVPPSEIGTHTVDLNSRSATHIASIVFLPVQQHNLPIIQFEVRDCLQVCQHFRHWLQTAGPPDIREVVRIDEIGLNVIAPNTKGNIFFLEGAATLEGEKFAPVSIFALQNPRDKHVRYLWTPLSPSLLLSDLAIHDLIGPPIIRPGQFKPAISSTGATLPPYHHTLYTIIAQCFEDATKYPDSPAMIKATRISDVCPSILDPATAHQRIDAADDLHSSHNPKGNGKDLSDDRYIHDLHPAERELASLLRLGCADYLLIKRTYFKAFSRETVLHAAKVRRATAFTRNSNRAAGTGLVEVKDEDEEDEGEESDIPPAVIPPVPNPRDTPSMTRSRTCTRQDANQQNVNQTALDNKQIDESSAADSGNPRAASLTAHSRPRLQRAGNQQNVIQAVPHAGTEQADVTMKDAEVEDAKPSEDPPARTPNLRVTRSNPRTRRPAAISAANSVTTKIATRNVKQAVPRAGTDQNDVTMKDNEDVDAKKSSVPSADTPNPRATGSRGRPRRSAANSSANSIATQNVNRAVPRGGTEQHDVTMKDKQDEGDGDNMKQIDEPPADTPNPKAARSGARTRRSAAESIATQNVSQATSLVSTHKIKGREEDDGDNGKENDDSPEASPNPKAAPPTARPRGRPRLSAANSVARVATPIESEDAGDEEYGDDNQSYDSPAPTDFPNTRAAHRSIGTATATRSRARRPRLSAAELAASRSNAAFAGARNRALRVRTTNKHIRTLEEQAGFTYRRAYKMILGWEVLGFLDEGRVLAVQEGKDNDGDGEWSG